MPSPPSSPHERRRELSLLVGLWSFILLALCVFHDAVLPFAGAALIAYIVAPAVERLKRVSFSGKRMPHWGAILVIYAAFFLGLYVFLTKLAVQLFWELKRVSELVLDATNSLTPTRIEAIARRTEDWLRDHGVPVVLSKRALEGADADTLSGRVRWSLPVDLERMIREGTLHLSGLARENFGNIFVVSRNVVVGALTTLFAVFFILMVAAFFSVDSRKIGAYFKTLVPAAYGDDAHELVSRIDRSLGGVVRGQLTICVINGTLTFVGLLVFGVKFAFVLATMATVFSLIPIFGTILSSVPIVVMGLAQSWKTGLGILLWILGIHALEAYFLNPKIMGHAARIHPVVVAFALVAGERTFGLLGALFAVPLAAILVACFDYVREKAQPGQPLTEEA